MMITEIERHAGSADRNPSLTVEISDGRKPRRYMLIASPGLGSVTVYAGAITRRNFGKTFWGRTDLVSHYKRDGETLAGLVDAWPA